MDQRCEYCDHPDSSLLRVVLIGEIIRADDTMLYTLAEVCETLGLLQLSDEDNCPTPAAIRQRVRQNLRRVK